MTKRNYNLTINGKAMQLSLDPDTPLLWALRDGARLPGTKYGCGAGICGACTVLVDGTPQRSCTLPVEAIDDRAPIVTIEGIAQSDPNHPVLAAWNDLDVPQCGYCQSGQIMAAIAFLEENPSPTAADVRAGLANYCRCGTYDKIAEAISQAASRASKQTR